MNKKTLLFVLPILAFIAIGVGLYLYNKPLESLEDATAAESLEASALLQAYEADEQAANTRFLGKTIQVSGKVLDVSTSDQGGVSVSLDAGGLLGGVLCTMDAAHAETVASWTAGREVSLKGECVGFLSEVQLARCVPVQ